VSNGRRFRRQLAVSRKATDKRRKARQAGRWPFGGPSLSSVRRWLKQAEAAGLIERCGVERTGKPGRPAQLWGLTEAGKNRPATGLSLDDEMHVMRVERLLRRARGKALTEDQIMADYRAAMAPADAARGAA
jgi:predicted ArsR family transcriptional regulator